MSKSNGAKADDCQRCREDCVRLREMVGGLILAIDDLVLELRRWRVGLDEWKLVNHSGRGDKHARDYPFKQPMRAAVGDQDPVV